MLVTASVLVLVCGMTAAKVAAAGPPSNARYYVALGDSLSTGFQPTLLGEGIETHSGYVNDIYAAEQRGTNDLELVDFGCPGDTTTSLLSGRGNDEMAERLHCDRDDGSQLGAALTFLRSHDRPGEVPLITIDIGINDLNHCTALTDPSACLQSGEAAISRNLPRILHALRAAAAAGTHFAAMTLYDTYLGKLRVHGATAAADDDFLDAYREANATIVRDDRAAGFRTADVAGAFDTYDTTLVRRRHVQVPENVARTCLLTWSCSPPPINHNIHPDGRGYRVIAREYERVIGRLTPRRGALRRS